MSFLYAFLGFAALIVLHELGHFAAAKAVGMRVERFSLFFPPLVARFRRKGSETEYAIGAVPLGGYVKISGMAPDEDLPPEVVPRAYLNQPVWKRVVVIAAGPLVNVVIAFALIFVLFTTQGVVVGNTNAVDVVGDAAPATGQLQPGDRIVSVDGVTDPDEMSDRINSHACPGGRKVAGCKAKEPVRLEIQRGDERRTLALRPTFDPTTGDGGRMRLGFGFEPRRETLPAGEAAGDSVRAMWNVTELTVTSIVRLFYDEQARSEVSGVVGSYEATRQSFDIELARAVQVLALISLSLAIINLFPFLPLDGGHIFWAVAEKVRGRRIPFKVMERASVVGFFLVMVLFVIGLSNDLGRLTGEGFDVR